MLKRNYLIILCGLPASGKSKFAREVKSILETSRNGAYARIVDPDRIRKKLYSGVFNYKKESIVRKRNLREIQSALKKGFIVISDDLNYYTSMRHDLKEVAVKLHLPYYIIHISTPVDQCITWNEKRGKPIPNEVIYNINQKFDLFNTYSWDTPFSSFNLSEVMNLRPKIEQLLKLIEQDIKLTLEQSVINKTQKIKNRYKEKLDQITRKIVNHYLKDLSDNSLITEILSLRKVFIKQNLDKEMSNSEIAQKFNYFLKMQLKREKFNSSH
ncbi:MAG: adenylyl-sulfate kinase [Promethearchaeota archaeon]|nr:MAG: adenylyl-sulfate kinase [Candidatus Lokiarchaeota archaeon]